MNYLKLINSFWRDAPYMDGYKSDYGILYFSLLDFINTNNWRETEIEYDRIINKTRIGKRMYLESRAWLIENGLIMFQSGRNDYVKAKFWIDEEVQKRTTTVTTTNKVEVQKCTATDTATVTTTDTATVPHIYNKPLNYKTNKPINNNTLNDFQKNENLDSDKNLGFDDSEKNGVDSLSTQTEGEKQKEKSSAKKEKETNFPFQVIWGMYGKKGSVKVAKQRYEKLSETKRAIVFDHVPKYVASTPEIQYRKNFEVYINKESFNDQIIQKNANSTNAKNGGFRGESGDEYLARVGSELNEIFELKFGRSSHEPAHELSNERDGYTSFTEFRDLPYGN